MASPRPRAQPNPALPFALLCAGLFAALAAHPTRAGAEPRVLDLPRVVHVGEIIEVRWQGVPREADEMELLLSLDGGRHFDQHISPEMDPRLGVYRWRVPDLPCADARLMLRYGEEGGGRDGHGDREAREHADREEREHADYEERERHAEREDRERHQNRGEFESESSRRFQIAGAAGASAPERRLDQTLRHARLTRDGEPPSASLAAWHPDGPTLDASGVTPEPSSGLPAERLRPAARSSFTLAIARPVPPSLSNAPRHVPMRN